MQVPAFSSETRPGDAAPGKAGNAAAGKFCVFVSSSDRARDIFEIVFQNSETMWRNCNWPRYVGFTSTHPDMYGFKAVAATKPSDWRGEISDQLDRLPDEIQYLFLTFEDALFLSPVNGKELNEIADLMVREDLSYVSLIPVRRNLPGLIVEFFRRKLSKSATPAFIFRALLFVSGRGNLETQPSEIAAAAARFYLGFRTHRRQRAPLCGLETSG